MPLKVTNEPHLNKCILIFLTIYSNIPNTEDNEAHTVSVYTKITFSSDGNIKHRRTIKGKNKTKKMNATEKQTSKK